MWSRAIPLAGLAATCAVTLAVAHGADKQGRATEGGGRAASQAPASTATGKPIHVGGAKQLFIDDKFIAASRDVMLTMNPPVKTPRLDAGPIMHQNRDVDFGNVFVDPKAPASQRYKRVYLKGKMSQKETAGLYIAYSADRENWTEVPERVFPFWPDGENTVMYDPRIDKYVAYFRQWVRRSPGSYFDAKIKPLRVVGRLEIDDPLKPWPYRKVDNTFYLWGPKNLPCPGPEFQTVLACDAQDPPECDFYDHGIMRYPWAQNVYLSFPVLYRHFPDPPGKAANDGLSDVQLATSRDGVHWRRFRGSYIRLGPQGSGDASCIYYSRALLRDGDRIRQYYVGYPKTHGHGAGEGDNPRFGGMVVQRLDGFVSADAAYEGGELTTPPVLFDGNRLELNVDTSAVGDVRVEMLDAAGKPVPGFSLADADMIQGNFLRKAATWRGSSDVSCLAGKAVRLRFVMRAAKLYAFQFQTQAGGEGGVQE